MQLIHRESAFSRMGLREVGKGQKIKMKEAAVKVETDFSLISGCTYSTRVDPFLKQRGWNPVECQALPGTIHVRQRGPISSTE